MRLLTPLHTLLLLSLCSGPALAAKSTATSFCKCICFNNSTIIALNPPPSTTSISSLHNNLFSRDAQGLAERQEDTTRPSRHKQTCADCTRAFCLDYNLPICKNARVEDVFTTCFQRDSLKDETVVVVFIFATACLLAWAFIKPWIDRLRDRASFTPSGRSTGPEIVGNQDPRQQYGRGGANGGFSDDAPGEGRGGRGAGKQSRRNNGKGHATLPSYDEDIDADMHADQDAEDIVSALPSSSGSRQPLRS